MKKGSLSQNSACAGPIGVDSVFRDFFSFHPPGGVNTLDFLENGLFVIIVFIRNTIKW